LLAAIATVAVVLGAPSRGVSAQNTDIATSDAGASGTAGEASSDSVNVLGRDSVLRDAEIPVLGNPQGDITIVEYFDYQCPYCKKIAPDLAKVVRDDGRVRWVLKDWAIFGDVSMYAAKLVLAAKYQDKFEVAHKALIGHTGRLTEAVIDETLTQAGVDVPRAKADLEKNTEAVKALLVRNDAQAKAFGFPGTPGFIIGTFRVPTSLTAEQFKQAIADARSLARKSKPAGKSK
jgi:protein-disulfide isomerase